MKINNLFIVCICTVLSLQVDRKLHAQLPGFLPDIPYREDIQSPSRFLGFNAGEWHVSHDQVVAYCNYLARLSERMELEIYARSHEQRPLFVLKITAPARLGRLEEVREKHVAALGERSPKEKTPRTNQPIILYQAYSIHGDEASGSNSALWLAWYLASGESPEIESLLREAVIILDPCQNPDGLQRFSSWVNSHKNILESGNPLDREFHQSWPGGRTNHYWFDLNRDWLLLQHPESRGRVALFQKWKPHIVTDHHEMGANSTFFFMPGVPSRTNPLTPQANQDLTDRIADFHRAAFDRQGISYYSKEGFDDFYYGKGSTYPDGNGAIGILFEQAGTEGHVRKTEHGELTLYVAMRNQMISSLSTQKAALELKDEVLAYQRGFFRNAVEEAASDSLKGYLFGLKNDPKRLELFKDLLNQHAVEYRRINSFRSTSGSRFEYEHFVPLEQMQSKMVRAIFEQRTSFPDSVFYDVSAWTLPLAYGIHFEGASPRTYAKLKFEEGISNEEKGNINSEAIPLEGVYGFAFSWENYYAPAMLHTLLDHELTARVTENPVTLRTLTGPVHLPSGSIFVPVTSNASTDRHLSNMLGSMSSGYQVKVHTVTSGTAIQGSDLGSNSHHQVRLPKVLLLTGEGVSDYEAGEIWFTLDTKFRIPVVKADINDLDAADLADFNTIILPGGRYNSIGKDLAGSMRTWVENGGTLILQGQAIQWANAVHLASVNFSSFNGNTSLPDQIPYEAQEKQRIRFRIPGVILAAEADLSHPLCFGLGYPSIAIMKRGSNLMQPASNPYATPIRFTGDPLLSGYLPTGAEEKVSRMAAVIVNGIGNGKVICLGENLLFRGTWLGTEKIFANAIFFAPVISGRTVQRVGPASEQDPGMGEE